MAAANNKKKVRTRRRERKNIEKGQVHISSSFNNTMVTCTETPFPGLPPADSVSVAARNPLLSPRRPRRRRPQRQPWSMV